MRFEKKRKNKKKLKKKKYYIKLCKRKNKETDEKRAKWNSSQQSLMLACRVLPLDTTLMLSEAGAS